MIRVSWLDQKGLRNRSSKDLIPLTKRKPYIRCMNNTQLEAAVKVDLPGASKELERRKKRRAKKEVKQA